MNIKWAQEYNEILCPGKCCPLELCPEPDRTCESITGDVEIAYDVSILSGGKVYYYKTTKWTYGTYSGSTFTPNGGYRTWSASQIYNAWQNPISDPDTWKSLSYTIQTSAAPLTGSIVVSYEDLINQDTARSDGETALKSATRWGVSGIPYGNECNSLYNKLTATGGGSDELAHFEWSRYKWSLPSSLITAASGQLSAVGYYVVKWDMAKASQAWLDWYDDYTLWKETTWHDYLIDLESWNECMSANDYDTGICGTKPVKPTFPGLTAEPTPAPSKVSSNTWTFTSPNSASSWYETEPTDSGFVYAVFNLNSQCYVNTSWGNLPSVYGRVYEF